ncbi:MAG: membrane protein insertase YidC [Deltaproteobacteria bacterium]|nr:membrane protein insertase YidC [Deltaproteobacteria bacterium]
MERKTLLAIVVSIAIILAWDYFVLQPRKQQEPLETPQTLEETVQQQPVQTIEPLKVSEIKETKTPDEIIAVDTDLYRATWSSRGAHLISLQLKKYKVSMAPDSELVEMVDSPFPVLTMGKEFSDTDLVYEASEKGSITVANSSHEIIFTAQLSPDIILKKIYTFYPQNYLIGYRSMIMNNANDSKVLQFNTNMDGIFPLDDKRSRYSFEGPVLLNGKHLEEFKINKIKTPGSYRKFPGEIIWFGFEDKYFLKAIIPIEAAETSLTVQRMDSDRVGIVYESPAVTIQPGTSHTQEHVIFAGPKQLKTLKDSGYSLNKALDFGFFDFIAKPMMIAMNWIYSYIHSYGWSIILLTIFIKILLYPLTLKSFTSMKGLQKIQPLMKELQAQYKDDRQKLNQEMMKLYSEHKINPMGGCLPMVLQIPILFALYRVFLSAIELRHTPFHIVGTWLPDLSAKDPYYIIPIVMGLSQFVQQKMTPTPGDPTQQKMMLMMPIVFTFIFLNFPSGLVLYWLLSNILSIIQQVYINRSRK